MDDELMYVLNDDKPFLQLKLLVEKFEHGYFEPPIKSFHVFKVVNPTIERMYKQNFGQPNNLTLPQH